MNELYGEFLEYLFTNFPNFPVTLLVPKLEIFGVLDGNDAAAIAGAQGPANKIKVLFRDIMPTKDKIEVHRKLVDIFQKNHQVGLATWLKERLDVYTKNTVGPTIVVHPDPHLSVPAPRDPASTPASSLPPLPSGGSEEVKPKRVIPTARPDSSSPEPIGASAHQLKEPDLEANPTVPYIEGGWSHKNELYEEEAKNLGDIADTAGQLIIQIRAKQHVLPLDFEDNPYYGNYKYGEPKPTVRPCRLALLINNHKFGDGEDRAGSFVDFANMENLLNNLGYDVDCKINRTAAQMLKDAEKFAEKFKNEKSPLHSCVVVLMTHGSQEPDGQWQGFMGVDKTVLHPDLFFKAITEHDSLAGIPKIFIIQACRGTEFHKPTEVKEDGPWISKLAQIARSEEKAKQAFMSKIPIGADTILMHSTTPGYFSWRNEKRGSWFIQAICEEFGEHAHKPWADLVTLSIRVTNKVATKFQHAKGHVQLPHTELNMLKKFHFFLGYQEL